MGVSKDFNDGDWGEKKFTREYLKYLNTLYDTADDDYVVTYNNNKSRSDLKGWDIEIKSKGCVTKGGLPIKFKYEVKYDKYGGGRMIDDPLYLTDDSPKSGNVAIEHTNHLRNEPSGINVTISDYWVQLYGKEIYIVNVKRLKEAIVNGIWHDDNAISRKTENAVNYLIEKEKFRDMVTNGSKTTGRKGDGSIIFIM